MIVGGARDDKLQLTSLVLEVLFNLLTERGRTLGTVKDDNEDNQD